MKSNFDFLNDDFPVLAQFGQKAEAYLFSDSNSCLMKLGMIGETIVNLMFTYDKIILPAENTAVNRISALYREGLLTQDLVYILHALRKTRNKAVHENYASVADGKALVQMAYSLCEWFMQTYGDWDYQNQPFVMPTEQDEAPVADQVKEKKQEEQLAKQAEETAAAAPAVAVTERKKQAVKAASQRQKSEAETRYMIDEQLRQVGWEVNTEEIRYSKGSRPAKGHNRVLQDDLLLHGIGEDVGQGRIMVADRFGSKGLSKRGFVFGAEVDQILLNVGTDKGLDGFPTEISGDGIGDVLVKGNGCGLMLAITDTDGEPCSLDELCHVCSAGCGQPFLDPLRILQVLLVFIPCVFLPFQGSFGGGFFGSGGNHAVGYLPRGTPENLLSEFVPAHASLEFVGGYLAVFPVWCNACH